MKLGTMRMISALVSFSSLVFIFMTNDTNLIEFAGRFMTNTKKGRKIDVQLSGVAKSLINKAVFVVRDIASGTNKPEEIEKQKAFIERL